MNSSELNWSSPLDKLFRSKTKTLEKLQSAGYHQIADLLWIFPLKVLRIPGIDSFQNAQDGKVFKGQGKIVSFTSRPNFRARGKRGIPLVNISLVVQDYFSQDLIQLKWFNAYPNLKNKLSSAEAIIFCGTVQYFQGQVQILTPEHQVITTEDFVPQVNPQSSEIKIQYPTINSISSAQLTKLFKKIPSSLWENIPEVIPSHIIKKQHFLNRAQCFQVVHCYNTSDISQRETLLKEAMRRFIYEEFFIEQMQINARKKLKKATIAKKILIDQNTWLKYQKIYPYQLTVDQKNVLNEIFHDLQRPHPMMRMIQGDVGCGKTSVALCAALSVIHAGEQVAFMCPTEGLADQHFRGHKELLEKQGVRTKLLTGGQSSKIKRQISEELANGEIDLIFGTHSLIQKNISFKSLGLAIIDEQHKFGVRQRQTLLEKGQGAHTLIMTATPIPRSLGLTKYGDLDISVIKNLPSGRKGIQTRIVETHNHEKYLQFFKSRLELKEQAYIVVPAINEAINNDRANLEKTFEEYKKYFPQFKIDILHGQMSSEEKSQQLTRFENRQIDILIATSVIEVGINVKNASIMAIISPERFGLSSLHQLRGRVGRGERPGFCFLVVDQKISKEGLKRLEVIEKHIDGFIIAEEDLKIRGEGNLIGVEQSGTGEHRKVADIVQHADVLEQVRHDLQQLDHESPTEYNEIYQAIQNNFMSTSI